MEKEIKVIKNRPDFDIEDDSDELKQNLDVALSDYKKIKRLIDYFFFGLLLLLIMYTIL